MEIQFTLSFLFLDVKKHKMCNTALREYFAISIFWMVDNLKINDEAHLQKKFYPYLSQCELKI